MTTRTPPPPIPALPLESIREALARSSLFAFVLQTFPSYEAGWVHREICRELEAFYYAVRSGLSPRLMITMPPRHGKSELAARRFPAYVFGRSPHMSIIGSSYSSDLASRMNRDIQRIMTSEAYARLFPGSRLKGGAQAGLLSGSQGHSSTGLQGSGPPKRALAGTPQRIDSVMTNARQINAPQKGIPQKGTPQKGTPQKSTQKSTRPSHTARAKHHTSHPSAGRVTALRNADFFEMIGECGSYRSAGVGGGITGMGGDILIIDDPFKDRASAESAQNRADVWDWYTSTLYTRLNPGGGILLINTRWHADDLSGRLIKAQQSGKGDIWRTVDYPAIALCDEAHRNKGEALHAARFPLEALQRIQNALGSRDWQSLYQQRPVAEGGAIFQAGWMHHYRADQLPQRFDRMLISWDMAFKSSASSDYVVGQVWGKKGAVCYLLDQVRRRMSFTETLGAFAALSDKWPRALEKLVEDKANGPAVIDSLRRSVMGIIPVEPQGSKKARAHAVTPLFEAGNVLLPDPDEAPWVAAYIDELLQFPSGAHDDQVDATTQALGKIIGKCPLKFAAQ